MDKFYTKDKIVSVFYTLLRDFIQPGDFEKVVKEVEENGEFILSNKYLAEYAQNLSERCKNISSDDSDEEIPV